MRQGRLILAAGLAALPLVAGPSLAWQAGQFMLDGPAPDTVLVTSPLWQVTDRAPVFLFTAPDEPGATFECGLDGGAFVPCASPWSPGLLMLGPHHVAVRAVDAAGNTDPSPASAKFTVSDAVTRSPPPAIPGDLPFDIGVRLMGDGFALNLGRVVGALRTEEMPAVLRQSGLTVRRITALMPGTVSVAARAPTRSGNRVLLRGSRSFDAKGSGRLVLRPTRAGREMMRHLRSIRLLLTGRFSSHGLSLTATRRASLVRDWLTAREARRAVAAAIQRRQGVQPKRLSVKVVRRYGSGGLAVRVTWLHADALWTTTGRTRQSDGKLRATLRPPHFTLTPRAAGA